MRRLRTSELILLILIVGAVCLRFVGLMDIPIFYDEAIYLDQTQSVASNIRNAFIPLDVHQFPVMTWVLALIQRMIGDTANPLMVMRVVMIIMDCITAYLIYLIGSNLRSRLTGLIAALTFVTMPLTFIHGRFVMLEPLTAVFTTGLVFQVLMGVKGQKYANRKITLWMIAAFFTKPLAVVTIIPAALLPLFLSSSRALKDILASYQKVIGGLVVGVLIMLMVYLPLSHYFTIHVNAVGGSALETITRIKFDLLRSWIWARAYITWPTLGIVFCGGLWGIYKKKWIYLWLLVWIMTVIVLDSVLGKHYYPRHLHPASVPIALLAALTLSEIVQKWRVMGVLCGVACCALLVQTNIQFIANPQRILVGEDRQQFFTDWSSGVGLQELADEVSIRSQQERMTVYVEDESLTKWALPNLYNLGDIELIPIKSPDSIEAMQDQSYYVVVNNTFRDKMGDTMQPVWSYQRPHGAPITLYYHAAAK